MMITKIEFVFFYTLFLLFVIYISGMAGRTIFASNPAFENVPTDAATILNPLANFGFWISLLTISTEYQILFTLVMLPMIVTLVWILIELARGV